MIVVPELSFDEQFQLSIFLAFGPYSIGLAKLPRISWGWNSTHSDKSPEFLDSVLSGFLNNPGGAKHLPI